MTAALDDPTPPRAGAADRARSARRAGAWDTVAIVALAFVVRVATVLLSRGGYGGIFGYDPGVYYAATDAFTFGRFPYTDFVLLHPPAVLLVLTPFAAIGRMLGDDHLGFMVATVAFELLGAVNAGLVYLVALRLHLARFAAVVGAIFAAVWFGAVGAELGVRLEPLGNFAFLVALLVLSGDRAPVRRRSLIIAGFALAVAVSTKVWWIVPALVVLGWRLRRRRDITAAGVGFVLSLVVIDGPFVGRDIGAAWHRIVLDQLGRPRGGGSVVGRLEQLAGLRLVSHRLDPVAGLGVLVALAGLTVLVLVGAWRSGGARVAVVLFVAQLAVLLFGPAYFGFYADFLTVAAALAVAGAVAAGSGARAAPFVRGLAVVAIGSVAIVTVAGIPASPSAPTPFPGRRLAAAVEGRRCVMADAPTALIELDALSRGLAAGCPNWIDVTGRTYGADKADPPVLRPRNRRWQVDVRRYLLSGDAVILIRPQTGLSPGTLAAVRRQRVLAHAGGYTVYLVVRR